MINQSKKTRLNRVATLVQMVALVVMLVAGTLKAAPTRRQPLMVRQPDGKTVTIVPQGDEYLHWVTDTEGRLLEKDAEGYYRLATEGQLAEWQERANQRIIETRAAQATRAKASAADANHLSSTPTIGKLHALTILVEFQDKKFSDSENALKYYQEFLMKHGFDDLGSNGSVRDYFVDNSMGLLDPQFDVVGPVLLSHDESYYGENNRLNNDKRPYEMVVEACQLVDNDVDFSLYDNDGDGMIDVINIIYAGEGENNNPDLPELIWPHSSSIVTSMSNNVFLEGKLLGKYVCSCELYEGKKDGIGTFCHEFCHYLGLPDDYIIDSHSAVNGDFDMLDSGMYLGYSNPSNPKREGRCPCALSSYQRYELGWLMPSTLIPNKYNGVIQSHKDTISVNDHLSQIITVYDTIPEFCKDTLPCLTRSNQALIFSIKSSSDDPRDGEYYLFENRQQIGWDKYLPAHGMLVWHIDYVPEYWEKKMVNTTADHPCVQLIRAREYSNLGTAFPGSPREVNQFNATTNPAFLGWDQNGTGSSKTKDLNNIAITSIKEELIKSVSPTEKSITFRVTDDGPDHLYVGGYTDIESIEQDDPILISDKKSSQPRHIWRDGQLLIETSAGIFDLQGIKR